MAAPNEEFTEVDLPLISRNQLFLLSEQTNNWAEQRMAFTKSKYKVIEQKEGWKRLHVPRCLDLELN